MKFSTLDLLQGVIRRHNRELNTRVEKAMIAAPAWYDQAG